MRARDVDSEAVFTASTRERVALANLIDSLHDDQLASPSLCSGWDIRTVAAHLAAAVSPSKWPFVLAMVRHRGDPNRANDTVARRLADQTADQLAATLRRYAGSRFAPPVVGPCGPLTDVLVHGGDMRIPLGLLHEPEGRHVRLALEFVTTGRPVGFVPKGRLDKLRLVCDDVKWSWGSGAAISGRGIDVLMAACGRSAVIDRLSGLGVAVLSERLPR
ncbi:maleylpyruvate isomerase family mycothiol-dependent enzyme [Pseudonocardia sp.]|uniref:maleylpyruvate isomerase family mycothiol-dependent enzyme n=1 Tax=Pseudonocardia sp. TaxID=60912 RepID=UPI0031FDE8B9